MSTFRIGNHSIGDDNPTFIVAEMSANHLQDLDRAKRLVAAAKIAGADAVKVQTYTADTLTLDCTLPHFMISGTAWAGRTLYDVYAEGSMPWEWHAPLQQTAQECGLEFFSTPFDETAIEFLEELHVPAHKIASFELVDLPLISKVAATGKPLILSTGMGTLEEIEQAVDTFREMGGQHLALLKCTSAYPAPYSESNLITIPDLSSRFHCPVGLSDHTPGIVAPVVAVSISACIIEKHFTLNRTDGGPDAAFSLEPAEFKEMVSAVRNAEAALGRVTYELTDKQRECIPFRRSLFVVRDMNPGDLFTPENVRSIRPGHGLPPRHLVEVLGKQASMVIPRGTPLGWGMIR